MALILLCHEPELREGGPTTRCLDVTVRVRPYVAVNDNEWALYRLSVCPFVRLILTRNRIESQPRGMEGRRRDDRFHHHVDGWMAAAAWMAEAASFGQVASPAGRPRITRPLAPIWTGPGTSPSGGRKSRSDALEGRRKEGRKEGGSRFGFCPMRPVLFRLNMGKRQVTSVTTRVATDASAYDDGGIWPI